MSEITAVPSKGQAGADPYAIPLERIDVSDSELFETDSSAHSIVLGDPPPDFPLEAGFITLDGARHDAHRKVVQPVAAPRNIGFLEPLMRARIAEILDGLPVGEPFDWVDRVSIEVTTCMLAVLFDFPYEQRRKLTFWSDMATASPGGVGAVGVSEEERRVALMECLEVFTALWKERQHAPAGGRIDFVTALATSEATRWSTSARWCCSSSAATTPPATRSPAAFSPSTSTPRSSPGCAPGRS